LYALEQIFQFIQIFGTLLLLIKLTRSEALSSSPKYLSGQISLGYTPSASAIKNSPFGQGRVKAFASVDELNPAARDSAASDVPFLRKPAMISALCQPFVMIPS
jgi:hypothetical protein